MKNPDYPAPGIHTPDGTGGQKNRRAGVAIDIHRRGADTATAEELDRILRRRELESRLKKRGALDKLREIKSALLVDLMEKVLPPWLRQRWVGMLMEIDFDSPGTDERIDRLYRECNAARGMLLRIMPGQGPANRTSAENHLVMLANEFNNLANQWWIYTSMSE